MINRRDFLKILVGAGAAVAFPFDLSSATLEQVDDAWALISNDPVIFDVEDKTVYAPWGEYPHTYGDVVDVNAKFPSRNALMAAYDEHYDLQSYFYDVFEEHASEEDSLAWKLYEQLGMDAGLAAWLKKAPLSDLTVVVESWLASDLPSCYEMPLELGPVGEAFGFFQRQDFATLKVLGVVIVEGEHPGSSYYAAELRVAVTDANYAAAALDLPIRFREVA